MNEKEFEAELPIKDGLYDLGDGTQITREALQEAEAQFVHLGVIRDAFAEWDDPASIIGEPIKSEVTDDRMRVTFRLYKDNKRADIISKILQEGADRLSFAPAGYVESVTTSADGKSRFIDKIVLDGIDVYGRP